MHQIEVVARRMSISAGAIEGIFFERDENHRNDRNESLNESEDGPGPLQSTANARRKTSPKGESSKLMSS